ncbi:uncharacterized protein [Amphiura filiformis]|uniref:uncharacterized protein n=1 Tax=Amphiura filiformis TaxID=82378 RepID=UPI003B228D75
MGGVIQKLFSHLIGSNEMRILIVGLAAAGKTTILLKFGAIITTTPTPGFNVETMVYKNINFTSWDLGGQDNFRPIWRHYLQNTQGLIFVLDSNDRERVVDAREELMGMIDEEHVFDKPVLILANKQDLPNAMDVAEVTDKLGLSNIRGRAWFIQATSATSGDGLYEGLDWLTNNIQTPNSLLCDHLWSNVPVSFIQNPWGT